VRLSAQCPDGAPPPCASGRTGAAAPRAGSVAILYIAARDSADAYLADGLTEDVTTLLSRRAGLAVKPSSSVRLAQRRQPDAAPRALGRTLAVRYVVQGSLRRAADRVRLNVQLIEAGSDVSVWGETYDRTAQGMLDLPSELANEIGNRVGGAASRAPTGPVWHTANPTALDRFRRGNFLLATRQHFAEAYVEYREAARLDPRFASAVARSAYAMGLGANYGGGDSLVTRGLELAGQALQIDSSTSDAWMALGYLRSLADPRALAGASDAFDRAVALDSGNAEAWHQYGQVLAWLGDDAGAVRAVERALAIEPARAVSLSDLAYYAPRDPARALRLADSALAINADFPNPYGARALARLRLGQPRAALADAEVLLGRWAGWAWLASSVRMRALIMLGDSAPARAALRDRTDETLDPDVNFYAATVSMALGDTLGAVAHLEHIPAAERNARVWLLLRQPEFDGLRSNPRFSRIYLDSRPAAARAP